MDIKIDLKIICKECKNELIAYSDYGELIIEPCENCITKEKESSWQLGYDAGFEDKTEGLKE